MVGGGWHLRCDLLCAVLLPLESMEYALKALLVVKRWSEFNNYSNTRESCRGDLSTNSARVGK